ncbi:MAG: folate-binding protein [Acetobacteraceae bacterium]|nr:folate-binding protein [Acetobacteraceae bacterium]
MPVAMLPDRGVVEVSGEDRVAFLQGLVSNDVSRAAPGAAVWAALLTPQGKWLADFFVVADGERLLLEVEAAQAAMTVQKLSRFRLRSKVALREVPLAVAAGWGDDPRPAGLSYPDPRLPEAGWRALVEAPLPGDGDYDAHRLALGLPDGSRDLEAEQSILLEAGFDELHGVSWTKGCYMGQELTARTKYRGLVKRRLAPVEIAGDAPPRGTPITLEGAVVGEMRSSHGARGLAVLRLPALRDGTVLEAGGARLAVRIPGWMRLPEAADA